MNSANSGLTMDINEVFRGSGRPLDFPNAINLALIVMLAAAGIAAAPAFAQIHKCKNSDGSLVFQEAPCGTPAGVIKTPAPAAAPAKSVDKSKPADTTTKAMNDAFQLRMDQQDYDGAMAFATTDKQKELARRKAAEKTAKCESLLIKANKAQADFKNRGQNWKPAADAAEAEYRLQCK
jgi:hypothetical protein